MSWDPFSQPTNYALVSRKKTPGILTVRGAEKRRKLDERGGYGLDYGWLIYTGLKLSAFSFDLRLYNRQDWLDWIAFRPVVQKVPKRVFTADGPVAVSGRGLGALDIWHPLLEPLGIKSAVVENEPQAVLEDETGLWLVTIDFKQYNPTKPAIAKVQGSQEKPTTDPVDLQILQKMDTLHQELAK